MASQNSRLENQILHFSKQKKWDKVEALWPQFVESPSSNPKFYATIGLRMVKQEKQDDLKSWIMLLLESLESIQDHASLIRVARGVLTALPEFDELRQPLITTLRVKFAKNSQCEVYLEACGLGREEGLNEPLKRFLRYIKCSVGEVFQHAEWGEGQVATLDLEAQRVHIDFPKVGSKSFSFEGVNEFLKKIPKSHLYAQRLLGPERLAQRAKDTPVEFLKFCLKCLGGSASRAELKDALTVGVFDMRKWNSWWTRSRDHFRFDPYIGFSGTAANVRLELRTEPKDFHEELLKDFLVAETFSKEYSLVTDLLRVSATRPVSDEIAKKVVEGLDAKFARCNSADLALRTEYLYLFEDVRDGLGVPCPILDTTTATDQLLASDNLIETICDFSMADNQVRAAKELKESYSAHWAEYAELLFLSAPMRIG